MANDSQRDKARATFGKTFFENSKALPDPKNSMVALQKGANARPIPTFKVGGVVKRATPDSDATVAAGMRALRAEKDFTGLMKEAAARAAAKGMPVMKDGGATDEFTAKRIRERIKAGNFKDGGLADLEKNRIDRKKADIEKDYKIALAKGKNANVAKAKYEQRMFDADDDYAKATGADRSKTRADEKAGEAALSEARRTKGASIVARDAAARAKAETPSVAATAIMDTRTKLENDFDANFGKAARRPPVLQENKIAKRPLVKRVPLANPPANSPANPPASAQRELPSWVKPLQKPPSDVRPKATTAGEAASMKAIAAFEKGQRKKMAESERRKEESAKVVASQQRNIEEAISSGVWPKDKPRTGKFQPYAGYVKGGSPIRRAVGGAGKVRKGMMKDE